MQAQQYKIERKGAKGEHAYLVPTQSHTHTLIWMHGLGDTADGYLDVFTTNINPVSASTKVVLLTAPMKKVTINFGMQMTSWFDFKDFDIREENFEQAISIEEIKESHKLISDVIDEEINILQGQGSHVFIGGFSQGGCMALHSGLQYPQKLGGILVFSGFGFPITKSHDKNKHTPILISHGTSDPLIPWEKAQTTFKKLEEEKTHKIESAIIQYLEHSFSDKSWKSFKKFMNDNIIVIPQQQKQQETNKPENTNNDHDNNKNNNVNKDL